MYVCSAWTYTMNNVIDISYSFMFQSSLFFHQRKLVGWVEGAAEALRFTPTLGLCKR